MEREHANVLSEKDIEYAFECHQYIYYMYVTYLGEVNILVHLVCNIYRIIVY